MLKRIIQQVCPPILLDSVLRIRHQVSHKNPKESSSYAEPGSQDLELYWDAKFAEILETWGEGNTWNEIQYLTINLKGKVLDIACGTGRVMRILAHFNGLELYGCDISDFLIKKGIDYGIRNDHLSICDATRMIYQDNSFDYAYSIGSLEHFTETGIVQCISECYRVARISSFHMMPVSRSGKDEGWLKTVQSFYNNSVDWWLLKFKSIYRTVYVLDSRWQDNISIGKWFVCYK